MTEPHWGPVESQVYETLFDPEHLKDKVPRMGDVLEGAARLRDVLSEIDHTGKHERVNGFTEDRSMQRIAKIDTNIQILLDQLHEAGCTCQQGLWGSQGHRAWFYKWLNTYGTAFKVTDEVKV